MMSAVRVVVDCCWHVGLKLRTVVMGPCFRRDDVHGIANRSVLPLLDMSTEAKPVTVRPRVPQSPCSLISNLLSRVQSGVVPPQFNGLSFNFTPRFLPSTASAKMKNC